MGTKTALTGDATQKVQDEIDAAIARGEDPFGDEEPVVKNLSAEENDPQDDGEQQQEEGEQASGDADDKGEKADEQEGDKKPEDEAGKTDEKVEGASDDEGQIDQAALEAVASDDEDDDDPVLLNVSDKDFPGEIAKLEAKESEIEADWSSGKLSDDERTKQLADLRKQIRTMEREQIREETKRDLNVQALQTSQTKVLVRIAAESKKANELDYGDKKVAAAYDAMLRAVLSDPENAGKSFRENARAAHDALCAVRGVKRAAPAASGGTDGKPAGEKPAPRKAPEIPVTLRGVPNAAQSNTGGSRVDAIGKLKGEAYQKAFDALSPAEKAQLLDD